jgi:hypothetical protein
VVAVLALALPCWAARLTAPANQAFEAYATSVEKRLAQQHSSPAAYLAALGSGATRTEVERQPQDGTLLMEPVNGGTRPVTGGLVHHWRGVAFVSGGLLIECEAISLTRDLPAGLGWLLAPVIQDMPRDSLKFTLTAARNESSSTAQKEAHR